MNKKFSVYINKLVINISTFGPIGFFGKAPGTNGSIVGLLLYLLIHELNFLLFLFLSILFICLAIFICGKAENLLKKKDPPEIILDEIVAIPICFIGLTISIDFVYSWLLICVAFILFRFFDIVKPFGIKKLQKLKGGFGIVVDDIAAALITCLLLNLINHFLF